MRSAKLAILALGLAWGAGVASAPPGFADTSRAHATGPDASAAAAASSSSSSTGRPCRVITPGSPGSTSLSTGAGGLSGTTTAGPNGPSVTLHAGGGRVSGSTSPGAGGTSAFATSSSGCVVVAPNGNNEQ